MMLTIADCIYRNGNGTERLLRFNSNFNQLKLVRDKVKGAERARQMLRTFLYAVEVERNNFSP